VTCSKGRNKELVASEIRISPLGSSWSSHKTPCVQKFETPPAVQLALKSPPLHTTFVWTLMSIAWVYGMTSHDAEGDGLEWSVERRLISKRYLDQSFVYKAAALPVKPTRKKLSLWKMTRWNGSHHSLLQKILYNGVQWSFITNKIIRIFQSYSCWKVRLLYIKSLIKDRKSIQRPSWEPYEPSQLKVE